MAEAGISWATKLKRAIAQIGPIRLAITIVFLAGGLGLARYSWSLPLSGDAERGLYDLRAKTGAPVIEQPDDRILLLVYTDETLQRVGKRSPVDRHILAQALRVIDQLQPRAIGIDIFIDQAQPEDEELIAALRAMRTPTYLAFTTHAANPSQVAVWQEQWMRRFFGRVGPSHLQPASIRLDTDLADMVMRRWPGAGDDPQLRIPLLANAMASSHTEFIGYRGAIDFTRAPPQSEARRFNKIQIDTIIPDASLPAEVQRALAEGFADQIRGRYILIGGDINDADDFETPMTRFGFGWTKGIEVHAQLLAQQLDGRMRAAVPSWALWLTALLLVVAGGLTAAFDFSGWRLALALLIQIAAIAWLPFQLHFLNVDTLSIPAAGWGGGWLLAFIGVGTAARAVGSEQKRFAQSALGKYLPPDVAREIMRNPERLALHGEQTEIYALFTDLEGFTKLSHAITPETLSKLLNRYLDLMSEIVLKHGGTLDKFVGDALVTFWGAPIARTDDPDRAVRAGRAMYEAGETFRGMAREIAGEDIPPIGVTRVGLHRGEAVVGNFGGEGRIQYTALGDAMNTAARLESANKALKTTMLVSDEAKRESSLDCFRPMGRVVLSGRATPVMVWEPVPDMDSAFRAQLNDAWARFDAGDREALVQLEAMAADHKEDAALQYFVYRCREVGSGGHFVLGSK
jgi:adenylate cyclase